jgi:glutathione peroxidase-family protein
MKLAIAVVLLAGCSKDPAKTADPKVIQGPQAAASDPKNLPAPGVAPAATAVTKETEAMWNVPIKTLQGKDTKLADYRGKALMIVNVASKCGLTPQYSTLEALQKKYAAPWLHRRSASRATSSADRSRAPRTRSRRSAATKYGVTFPMMEKIDVNGAGRHEIYKALTPDQGRRRAPTATSAGTSRSSWSRPTAPRSRASSRRPSRTIPR